MNDIIPIGHGLPLGEGEGPQQVGLGAGEVCNQVIGSELRHGTNILQLLLIFTHHRDL